MSNTLLNPKILNILIKGLFKKEKKTQVNILFQKLKEKGTIPKKELVKKGDCMMHLGVWRIETILEWSRLVGENGKVIIVEADDLNYKINEIEVRRRMLSNVLLVNKGAWNKTEKITLQVSEISMRNKVKEAQTIDRLNPDSNYQEEKVIHGDTIDHILEDLGIIKINHVFMTISGAELEALGGMQETIKNNDLTIYIRAILINEKTGMSNSEKVVEYLTELGFDAKAAPKELERDGSNVYAIKKSDR